MLFDRVTTLRKNFISSDVINSKKQEKGSGIEVALFSIDIIRTRQNKYYIKKTKKIHVLLKIMVNQNNGKEKTKS